MKGLMSIDVEDWFQTASFKERIPKDQWPDHLLRVRGNVDTILRVLDKKKVKGTFFTLGWVAERVPEVVEKLHREGHEVASHGYGHDCVYDLSPEGFREDLRRSKEILEGITGAPVLGYRAPNFSITDWAIDILQEEGFTYDSSVFPTFMHDRYGKLSKFTIQETPAFELKPGFWEVPLSCWRVMGKNLPWSGGGYFRLIPWTVFKRGISGIFRQQEVYNFYIHPWEFDPGQPRIRDMEKTNRFRHYNNIEKTETRFDKMVAAFPFQTISSFLEEYKLANPQHRLQV